jgi:hypothetical protein
VVEERMKETLRWRKGVMDLKTLLKEVAKREGLEEEMQGFVRSEKLRQRRRHPFFII